MRNSLIIISCSSPHNICTCSGQGCSRSPFIDIVCFVSCCISSQNSSVVSRYYTRSSNYLLSDYCIGIDSNKFSTPIFGIVLKRQFDSTACSIYFLKYLCSSGKSLSFPKFFWWKITNTILKSSTTCPKKIIDGCVLPLGYGNCSKIIVYTKRDRERVVHPCCNRNSVFELIRSTY